MESAMGQLQLFRLGVLRDAFAGIPPCPCTSPILGVTEAKARGVWEQLGGCPGRPPQQLWFLLTKAKSPDQTGGSRSSKEKANFNTYHCCSKSQSLKKSNRSIAAGWRRRLAAVCPCSLRVAALSCSALSMWSAARLPGPPARLKVLGPHQRQQRVPGVPGLALQSSSSGGCEGDGTGQASA
ncbi:hypothetical protein NN561_011045 [Cricetulus griseus]